MRFWRHSRDQAIDLRGHRSDTGAARVRLVGRLDRGSVPEVRRELLVLINGYRAVDVDLSEVTSCDAAGLDLFVDLTWEADARGTTFTLHAVGPMLRDVLAATDLDKLVDVAA
jgi:anti-anti-sigma factor